MVSTEGTADLRNWADEEGGGTADWVNCMDEGRRTADFRNWADEEGRGTADWVNWSDEAGAGTADCMNCADKDERNCGLGELRGGRWNNGFSEWGG